VAIWLCPHSTAPPTPAKGALRLPFCQRCRDHVLTTNRAIPASTAFMFATCLQHHVPEVRAGLFSCTGPALAAVY
jgi:hypothetical protein